MENQAPTSHNALSTSPSPGEEICVGDKKVKEELNTKTHPWEEHDVSEEQKQVTYGAV